MDNEQASSKISQLICLPGNVIDHIFDYLAVGEIFYSFYHLNSFYRDFLHRKFEHLNFLTISYRYWRFYHHYVLLNNPEHGSNIQGLTISNEKPFDPITQILTSIELFPNLTRLYLKSPRQEHLTILPTILPNLTHLSIVLSNAKFIRLQWLSSLQQLERCSIEAENNGYEIENSTRRFSSNLSSLSITLSSTYDLHTLFPLLPSQSLTVLNIRLCDSEYTFCKTFRSSTIKLTDFTFDMTLKAITDPLSFYGILRLVSTALRSVQTLTILCRFADGIVIDEEKFRYYLSFIYSVNKFQFHLEMNNLPPTSFNQSAYEHSFWTEKNLHVNIYRSNAESIGHLRIYTLPCIYKEYQFDRSFQLVRSSRVSNIREFQYGNPTNEVDRLVMNELLRSNVTDYSFHLDLFYRLPYLSALTISEQHINLLLFLLNQRENYPKIRKIDLMSAKIIFRDSFQTILHKLPNLHCISVVNVNEFDTFRGFLHAFLTLRLDKPQIIYLCIGGLAFDEIYSTHSDNEQLKLIFQEIAFRPGDDDLPFDLSFTPSTRSIDLWF